MTKILIGTPCYGGQITVAYFQSMLRLLPHLAAAGIGHTIKTLAQESLISRARNTIVAEFLGRADHTHLLFVDADIGFEPAAIQRLIDFKKPVVATAYPMKGYDWTKIKGSAAAARDGEELKAKGLSFAFNPAGTTLAIEAGFVRATAAGTGLMLIERDAFVRMQQRYPELRYRNDIAGYDNEFTRGNFWTLFDTSVDPDSGRYLSEDYTFCARWTKGCGGEVWVDVESPVTHFGVTPYRGSFLGALSRT